VILNDTSGKSKGYAQIFDVVRTHDKIADLPPAYQQLAKCVSKLVALWVEKEMRNEKQLAKLKKVYRLTPIRAIRAALSIANPVKLMNGLINIFVARPFGSRNMVQKLSEVSAMQSMECSLHYLTKVQIMVEMKKTQMMKRDVQNELELHLKNFNVRFKKDLLKKLSNYIASNYSVYHHHDDEDEIKIDALPPQELVNTVLKDKDEPVLDDKDVASLNEVQVKIIHELIVLEMRLKEKQDFVELLGNAKILSIMRELLPIVHEPIAILFNKASVGMHFEELFKTIKRFIKVSTLSIRILAPHLKC
jgi:hypothetical protein